MLQVFRIETDKGEGPYSNEGRRHIDFDSYRQPCPADDGLGWQHEGQHFGFASINQLKRWFREHERQGLHSAGFAISVYYAPERREGRSQVTFPRSLSRREERLPLIDQRTEG